MRNSFESVEPTHPRIPRKPDYSRRRPTATIAHWQALSWCKYSLGMVTAPVFTGGTGPVNGTPSRAVSTSASTNKRAGTGGSTAVNTRPLTAVDGRRRVREFYQAFSSCVNGISRERDPTWSMVRASTT
ncbi:hypothetical protein C8F04DRAFT_1185170 [Mycena alexandri]|uniref:Uncharacterized protein n=1 Tax=Mycena alexandri TaxID=1745969 RepID=A0AAD6SSG7_9AGAR|nr:hypothetical protein C8F04DRAFT_1185170 [Mycena alexandri]